MTRSGHQPGRNPAPRRAPDLMITNPLCCLAGKGQQMTFDRLKRREFITLLGSAAAAWPARSRAQMLPRSLRVGIAAASPRSSIQWVAFGEQMRELGYVEGQNLAVEF